MQVSSGISIVGVILIALALLAVAGAIFFVVVLLRGGREGGAPPSRSAKIGCGVFALFAVLVIGTFVRGCSNRGDAPAVHTIEVRSSGSIFCGEEYRGEGTILLGPLPDGAQECRSGMSDEEIVARFTAGLSEHTFRRGAVMTLRRGGVAHELRSLDVEGSDGVGRREAVVLLVLRIASPDGTPTAVHVWPIRVRDGENRELTLGRAASSIGMRSSLFMKLLGDRSLDYTVEISTAPSKGEATYRVDDFTIPEPSPARGN